MSEVLIARHRTSVDQLVEAVALRNPTAVAAILNPLARAELEAVAIILADFVDPEATVISHSIRYAARVFGVDPDEIRNRSRRREVSEARAVACYAARLQGFSYPRIGQAIGVDHSTVMAACSRVGESKRLRGIAQRIAESLGWNREDGAVA